MSNNLTHLTPVDITLLEQLDEQIYDLQGKCRTQEDTLKLSELYIKRLEVLDPNKKADRSQQQK